MHVYVCMSMSMCAHGKKTFCWEKSIFFPDVEQQGKHGIVEFIFGML